MSNKIQIRRDVSSTWTSVNPTLSQGEPGFEVDTGRFKIGNGSSTWTLLPYAAASPTSSDTLTNKTWNGTNIGLAYGGTNASLTAAAGAAIYSTATGFGVTAVGTAGQVLTSNGAGAPTWTTTGAAITNDTSTNSSFNVLFNNTTSGVLTSIRTSSTKLTYNPSTGFLTANGLILNGASGSNRLTYLQTNSVARWAIGAGADAEGGSNTGSNFYLDRHNDAGVYQNHALWINRATGLTTLESLSVAGKITSTVATGSSPFTISSTTVNSNLNADMVDGYHANVGVVGSNIVVRDGSGYIFTNYLNMSSNDIGTANMTRIAVDTNADGFLRWQAPIRFKSALDRSSVTFLAAGNNGYQLLSGGIYVGMTASGAFSVNLPNNASCSIGDSITIYNPQFYGWAGWATYNLTITCTSQTCIGFQSYGESLVCNLGVGGITLRCVYNDTGGGSAGTVMWSVTVN